MIALREKEQKQIDLSLHEMEMKREALSTLVPSPEQIDARIDLIGALAGRRPQLSLVVRARAEQELAMALMQGKNPDMTTLDAVGFVHKNATSLDGFRSKQIVEIAKTEVHVPEKSILEKLTFRKA